MTRPEQAVARRSSAGAMPAGVGARCAYMLRNFSVAYKVGIILIVWGARALAVALADGDGGAHIEGAVKTLQRSSAVTYALVTCAAVLAFALLYGRFRSSPAQDENAPPVIPSPVPFLGHAVDFNKNPIAFLTKAYKQYGPVFTFEMVGKKFTYLLGSEASALFFNSRNDALNAEEVYGKLVTPVFGPGVAYDVPNDIFLEQKKIFKTGLSIARFREHVHMIEEETIEYLKCWGDSGEISLFDALSELIVLTASRCLHGREIRSILDTHVAQLYNDLDGGFCAEAWLLPSRLHWLVPRLRRRDAAHREMRSLFLGAIARRRAAVEKGEYVEDDMLSTLMTSPYKSGRLLTDSEIVGMLIGLLMAGQHTSSSTGSWLGLHLAANPAVQNACYAEQVRVRGGGVAGHALAPLDYDQLKDMDLLERCLKETLRLQPPLFSVMRKSVAPQKVLGYTIPANHQVCVSPTTNHRLEDAWGKDADAFLPDRFLQESEATSGEKFSYVPFGAGRHRCIGESFAYVQNKVIWSVLLERYELSLISGDRLPLPNYRSMIHTPLHSLVSYRRRTEAAATPAAAGKGGSSR